MKCLLLAAALGLVAAPGFAADSSVLLEKAEVLPLALDDDFQFRKVQTSLYDPALNKRSDSRMLNFERARVMFGAVTGVERRQRHGHYFKLFWRANRPADITVRLEYRQQNLGDYVQAREVTFKNARGAMKTEFEIVGDDYREDGRVTAWRALLIEKGRIVGLTQSYLWN